MSSPELRQPTVNQYNYEWTGTNAGGNDDKIDGFKPRRKTQGLNDAGAVRPKL